MQAIASAPGKTILFGEHSVVYGEPAIAGAVDKRAIVKIKNSNNNKTILRSFDLNFEAELNTQSKKYILKRGKPGIIRYILEALNMFHDHSPIEITLSSNIPIGSGLGSSAAVTVATLAALYRYHNIRFNKQSLANDAHKVEESVQGIASPLDTLVCTYGGLIYLSRRKTIENLRINFNTPFVIGFTSKHGNTGKMVRDVRNLKDSNPKIINPLISAMGHLTNSGKVAILNNNISKIGELMNINHGLLDALGVSTAELSRMVYLARKKGAVGAKITGAGGGGSIIALCPENINDVAEEISKYDNILKTRFTRKGVSSKVKWY
ncbi:mevalonate kinase [Methanobrevibacter sp. OttesenSCG-928-K11]|nr:mevalonate kinase [Methanobrevibacter sp. OttesenSCG-928-K11]MDL2270742.1 mevalonate kinase [Methanobrevibacter sp. OttesenSCG-928-I08]